MQIKTNQEPPIKAKLWHIIEVELKYQILIALIKIIVYYDLLSINYENKIINDAFI